MNQNKDHCHYCGTPGGVEGLQCFTCGTVVNGARVVSRASTSATVDDGLQSFRGISSSDAERMLRIADLVDDEALSWLQGFARNYGGGKYEWDASYPDQHARYIRLQSASSFLRTLAKRIHKKQSPSIRK